MAKTPKNALNLLETIWPSAIERVAEEVADMQLIANEDQTIIEPWDYRYYAEKVRQKKYDLDSDEVKQYLQLDQTHRCDALCSRSIVFLRFQPTCQPVPFRFLMKM